MKLREILERVPEATRQPEWEKATKFSSWEKEWLFESPENARRFYDYLIARLEAAGYKQIQEMPGLIKKKEWPYPEKEAEFISAGGAYARILYSQRFNSVLLTVRT